MPDDAVSDSQDPAETWECAEKATRIKMRRTALAALDISGVPSQLKNFLEAQANFFGKAHPGECILLFPQEITTDFSAIKQMMRCFAAGTVCARRRFALAAIYQRIPCIHMYIYT
jgi:hypothetical protein